MTAVVPQHREADRLTVARVADQPAAQPPAPPRAAGRRPLHAAPVTDWAEFYKGWQARGNVPDAEHTVIDENHAVFQAMYLDLAEIKLRLQKSGLRPPLVTVLADVLNVQAGTIWSTDGVLQVLARRVQTDGGLRINLDLRESDHAGLLLYCAELAGQVQAVAVQKGIPPHIFTVDAPPPTGGVRVGMVDGVPARSAVTWAQGVPVELPDWFGRTMRTEFSFGTLLYDAHPRIARAQFDWLKNWTGHHDELLALFLQSSALLALLTAQAKAADDRMNFVPYLSRTVYGELARAYVEEARQFESDYRALQTQKVVGEEFLGLARSLLTNKTYETEFAGQLLGQVKRNFDHAVAATEEAERTLRAKQQEALDLRVDFEHRGVPQWQREQIARPVIDLATAVVTFGVGIGAMLAGDLAGGGAAVSEAIEGAKAAERAAKAGSEPAELAAQLKDAMERLKKVAEGLAKAVELAKTVITVVGDLDHASSYVDTMRALGDQVTGADLTASYDWQVYQQATTAALKGPIDAGIGYAEELELACHAVAVHGQAWAAAQVATIQAGQRYAEVSLQVQLSRRQQTELEQYVGSLEHGSVPPAQLLQRFYELYLNAKTGLFTAAQGYRDSYFYWALRQSSINPVIVDGVDGLDAGLKNLTSIALDNQNAVEHFDPPPQRMTDKQFVVDDPEVLRALAAHAEASWVLPTQAETFAGYDRVRLSRVRVWLDGARLPDGASVDVRISTQGSYRDRFEGKQYQFTSKPLVRDFQYRMTRKRSGRADWRFPDGSFGYIELDGVVDDEVSYAYFQPTPFAQWHVSVRGKDLDLSGVTRVVMEFAGSVIPRV